MHFIRNQLSGFNLQSVKKIHHLIEQHAQSDPNRMALISPHHHQKWTYAELNQAAKKWMNILKKYKIKAEDRVPLLMEKSPECIAAMLGILKLGAVYVPMHADAPILHIQTIVQEVQATCVISDRAMILPESVCVIPSQNPEGMISSSIHQRSKPLTVHEDLAYIIYTSGTTGNPKGSLVTHRNLIYTYCAWKQIYQLTSSDIHLQMAPVGFDVFTGDWIRALASGATLVLCPQSVLICPEALCALIQKYQITCAEFVPSTLRALMNYLKIHQLRLDSFRLFICGSDVWTMQEYRRLRCFLSSTARVIGSYGLTETTIDSTYYEETTSDSTLEDHDVVPIGKPFPGVTIHILKDGNTSIAPGTPGEICISGHGVGLGYWNRDLLTQERFVLWHGMMMYRTGDQGIERPDGNIQFLGRNQEHVKIYGKRVELQALEGTLNAHPKIEQSLIIPDRHPNKSEQTILRAFLLLQDTSIDHAELMIHVLRYWPIYYMPYAFYAVSRIPTSLNGKVDRRFSAQSVLYEIQPIYQAPNDTESVCHIIIALWQDILKSTVPIGLNHRFDALGGCSLDWMLFIKRMEDKLSMRLPMMIALTHERLQDVALSVQQEQKKIEHALVPLSKEQHTFLKPFSLSFEEQVVKWWVLYARIYVLFVSMGWKIKQIECFFMCRILCGAPKKQGIVLPSSQNIKFGRSCSFKRVLFNPVNNFSISHIGVRIVSKLLRKK